MMMMMMMIIGESVDKLGISNLFVDIKEWELGK